MENSLKEGGQRGPTTRAKILFGLKLGVSILVLGLIFRKVVLRDGAEDLWERLQHLSWGWVLGAVAMQLVAIAFSTVRWQRLLVGQGIHAPWRFLGGSIMIARFWGAVTPGGFTGFGGWRIYDVGVRTGKMARATATIGVEMILGQLAFGVVVMAGSVFGMRFIGLTGVLLVNGFFVGLIGAGLILLARPGLVRIVARRLPNSIGARVQTLVDAVCAYQGKTKLLSEAAFLGMGTHAFNNMIYVCAAHALGVDLGIGEVFFGSSLQIFATLLPASINGIGLREAAAVALYAQLGVPTAEAVLIPIVGFAAEMFVSSFGGLIYVARRTGYDPSIRVDDADREEVAHRAIEEVAPDRWPRRLRGFVLGLSAGILAGAVVGLGEGLVVVFSGGGRAGFGVVPYGIVAYGLFCAAGGAFFGLALAWSGRWMKRAAVPEAVAYGRIAAVMIATMALGLGAFRIRRDVFHEELVWKSPKGLAVLVACLLAAAILYGFLAVVLPWLTRRKVGSLLLRPWGTPILFVIIVAIASGMAAVAKPAEAKTGAAAGRAPEGASNVLFIVVDTLRADRLPDYGYEAGRTPHLSAFADDAVRFDQAFANASWTRPSFASFLTGRYPSNHGVMSKASQLPDEVTTLPEALRAEGWATAGVVTNYNVAPYFNFQQGFDEYQYLEPDFVLGADDQAAKLLLIQFLRQRIETLRAKSGTVLPGAAYQDAEVVNRHVRTWLDRAPKGPWFYFAAYMDPHDPYFEHPYSGGGYARAAHQHPRPEEAAEISKLYDGEIAYWDTHFGALMEDLKKRGLYDELAIVVTADHGEEFFDHGGFWHGTTLYDEQVRVPLYVKLPKGRRGGTAVRHWVQSVDVMPTLLRELGVDVPKGVQGGDLFEGTDIVYAEESHEGNVLESVRERRGTEELKLITANPRNPRGLEPVELYRVDRDWSEKENLAKDPAAELEPTMKTLLSAAENAKKGALETKRVVVDDDAAARLRALGYAEEEKPSK
ncbi:MAG: sulfatase-like hydrolase/transferase [Myxococcales bacterium]|nr:sulfatase-like hydrolase/transferase [Myxococcales bacterium]